VVIQGFENSSEFFLECSQWPMDYTRKISVFFDVIFASKKKHHHIGILLPPTLFAYIKTVLIAALSFFNVVQKSIRSYLSRFAHASSLS
jgi:hypothetical protein